MPFIALYVIKLIEEESNDKSPMRRPIGSILLRCVTLDVYSIMSILNLYRNAGGTLPDTASLVRDTGEPDSKVVWMGLWCARLHNCPRYSLHPRSHC